MRRPSLLLALLLASLVGAAAAAAQDTATLRRDLEEAVRGYPGVVGVSLRDLGGGATLSIRGGEAFPTASLVKLPLLVALLEEVRAGRIGLDERLAMLARDRVGGSGVLRHLAPGLRPTVADAAWLMMVVSDNTATNLVLDEVGPATVAERMEALGLRRTRIHRGVFRPPLSSPWPDSAARYGLGVTTPDEMVRLLALLHEGRAVSPALDSLALEMLKGNQDGLKLARWLPEETVVAHKSGYDERAWNDCGILYTPAAPLALCVLTRENRFESYAPDGPANLLIARLGRTVFRHFNPDVPLPAVPGG